MDVHLLVYDLSGGLARDMSMAVLGFQLDAIYHTSIELQRREFVYDGGILEIEPGSSHLGRPMQRLHLGVTSLSMDVVENYLDSVRCIFTAQAYDLFQHNCNNFTDTFANFLVGTGIPEHISSMPQAVLDSPIGRMMLPRITEGMNARRNGLHGLGQTAASVAQPMKLNKVHNAIRMEDFEYFLEKSKEGGTIIFFTSPACAPCKALYPMYDKLALHYGHETAFVKIDTTLAHDIAAEYEVTELPTFITLFRGKPLKRWTGADPVALQNNVRLLAQRGHSQIPHDRLHLPSFADSDTQPILYPKVPPLVKLHIKMGNFALKPVIQALMSFIEIREKSSVDARLPGLLSLGQCIRSSLEQLEPDLVFTAIDLFRCAVVDPRLSAYFAEERDFLTMDAVLRWVNKRGKSCPYSMRLVTLHTMCNLFSTPLFGNVVFNSPKIRTELTKLISSSFLDDNHTNTRVAASSLLFNLSLYNRRRRREKNPMRFTEEEEVELAASLVEAIKREEESVEALHGMLLSLGYLFYGANLIGELADLLRALDAKETILSKKELFPTENLVTEVGEELLDKGLQIPLSLQSAQSVQSVQKPA